VRVQALQVRRSGVDTHWESKALQISADASVTDLLDCVRARISFLPPAHTSPLGYTSEYTVCRAPARSHPVTGLVGATHARSAARALDGMRAICGSTACTSRAARGGCSKERASPPTASALGSVLTLHAHRHYDAMQGTIRSVRQACSRRRAARRGAGQTTLHLQPKTEEYFALLGTVRVSVPVPVP
jgi:hypothetical protein